MASSDPDQVFAAAYAEVAPALHAWAHLRTAGALRQRLDPDDLVQEIVLRACRRAADFDPHKGPFRPWIFGFANRVWLELLRELGRDPLSCRWRQGGDSQLNGIVQTVTAISQRIARDEALGSALRRLDQMAEVLTEEDRRLLVCVGFEGVSHAAAAALLGVSEDTSRKRWQRLRERLQADSELRRIWAG